MGALKNEATYTIDDIYKLPEGQRAELIDGKIYYMALPTFRHQKILLFLNIEIVNYIKKKKGSCEAIPAPFAVFLNENNKTYVEPDISVICDKSKLTEKGCVGAPDWIIEIVSPSSKQMDYLVKMLKYSNCGVREYWIVDPLRNQIITYCFEEKTMEQYTFSDKVKASVYKDLEIDFSEIE